MLGKVSEKKNAPGGTRLGGATGRAFFTQNFKWNCGGRRQRDVESNDHKERRFWRRPHEAARAAVAEDVLQVQRQVNARNWSAQHDQYDVTRNAARSYTKKCCGNSLHVSRLKSICRGPTKRLSGQLLKIPRHMRR